MLDNKNRNRKINYVEFEDILEFKKDGKTFNNISEKKKEFKKDVNLENVNIINNDQQNLFNSPSKSSYVWTVSSDANESCDTQNDECISNHQKSFDEDPETATSSIDELENREKINNIEGIVESNDIEINDETLKEIFSELNTEDEIDNEVEEDEDISLNDFIVNFDDFSVEESEKSDCESKCDDCNCENNNKENSCNCDDCGCTKNNNHFEISDELLDDLDLEYNIDDSEFEYDDIFDDEELDEDEEISEELYNQFKHLFEDTGKSSNSKEQDNSEDNLDEVVSVLNNNDSNEDNNKIVDEINSLSKSDHCNCDEFNCVQNENTEIQSNEEFSNDNEKEFECLEEDDNCPCEEHIISNDVEIIEEDSEIKQEENLNSDEAITSTIEVEEAINNINSEEVQEIIATETININQDFKKEIDEKTNELLKHNESLEKIKEKISHLELSIKEFDKTSIYSQKELINKLTETRNASPEEKEQLIKSAMQKIEYIEEVIQRAKQYDCSFLEAMVSKIKEALAIFEENNK